MSACLSLCGCVCDRQGKKRGVEVKQAERWMPERVMREGRSRMGMKDGEMREKKSEVIGRKDEGKSERDSLK